MAHRHPARARAMATGTTLACVPRAFPQPALGLPADVLENLGLAFEAQLQRLADRGGRAIGPGACHERPSGMGVPGFGNRPRLAPRPCGVLRRDHAQELHQRSWGSETAELANCCPQSDGDGALHTAQGLQGLDHRGQAPRLHGLLPCLCETLEACGVCGHGTDLGLQDEVVRWCLTHDCRAPPARGGAPGGPARVAAIVSE